MKQKVAQKVAQKAALFQGKKRSRLNRRSRVVVVVIYYLLSKSSHTSNGRKQKRDANFTEKATQAQNFVLFGPVFDRVRARVEKSID